MQVQVAFRHMEPSSPLREYAEKKLKKLERLTEDIIDTRVVYMQEKIETMVEFHANLNGHAIMVVERSEDAYAATDLAVHKFERQINRVRQKSRKH